jgi:hypothetical protein
MRMLLVCRPYSTIVGDLVDTARERAGRQIQGILGSGKVLESGTLGPARGFWFLIEAASATELHALLGPLPDYCAIEAYPSAPLEDLVRLFEGKL